MKDPVLVAGWVFVAYLALRLAVEIGLRYLPPRAKESAKARTGADHEHPKASWTPLPAVLWLAAEAAVALVVVGVLWIVLRDVSLNLVPAGISAVPADVRHVALAVILGWTLLVINGPVAWRFIGRLLPSEPKKQAGEVDPERMGATIGVLERLLVVILVPAAGPAAVGFVVAAKTLARFKELNKKRFAERYLLGTMSSVTVALISAFAAQWIWTAAF
ncbi:MAG TPA: hypothetical protein VF337_03570 [Candidatus Limnocylindrales bacterium]